MEETENSNKCFFFLLFLLEEFLKQEEKKTGKKRMKSCNGTGCCDFSHTTMKTYKMNGREQMMVALFKKRKKILIKVKLGGEKENLIFKAIKLNLDSLGYIQGNPERNFKQL